MIGAPVVLEGVTVVTADRVERRDLAFANGHVVARPPDDALRVDAVGHFAYPGLVNAHDHLQLNCIPALPQDGFFADSYDWIDAYEQFMSRSEVRSAVAIPAAQRHWHGGYKNLLAGVTTVAHHDPSHASLGEPGYPVAVPHRMSWCHSLGLASSEDDRRPRYGPPVRESFEESDGEVPWVIHLAEGTSARSRGELKRLDAMACLASHTVIVHGVALGEDDIERIIDAGAAVVWCPSSNMRMLGATLAPGRLASARRLALGTDSRLTGSRDMLDEMRVAHACGALTAREVFRIATDGGREVLRLPPCRLQAGDQADCLIVRGDGDPYEALLRTSRSQLRAVLRNGTVMLSDIDLALRIGDVSGEMIPLRVDGVGKLIARDAARPDALRLECGVEVS